MNMKQTVPIYREGQIVGVATHIVHTQEPNPIKPPTPYSDHIVRQLDTIYKSSNSRRKRKHI